MIYRLTLSALLLGGLLSAGLLAAQTGGSVSEKQEGIGNTLSTGTGLICVTAMIELASHFGERCVEHENPELRLALAQSTRSLRQKLREQGGWSDEQLQAFLDRHAKHAVPDDILCQSAGLLDFYNGMTKGGADSIHQTTNKLLALNGPPVWGTCL